MYFQVFSITHQGELRREEGCLGASGSDGAHVRLEPCPVGKDLPSHMVWQFDRDTGEMKHKQSGLCMDAEHLSAAKPIVLKTCADKDTQIWEIEHYL